MKSQVSEEIKDGLSNLCKNAEIEFGARLVDMAQAVHDYGLPGGLRHHFLVIGSDPNAQQYHPERVHEGYHLVRTSFESTYSPEKKPDRKNTASLLVDIVLGENHMQLLNENHDELTSWFKDRGNIDKYFHMLRHGLFVKEDIAMRNLKSDKRILVNLAKKYIDNIEYCKKSQHAHREFYDSSSCLVSISGAYSDLIDGRVSEGKYEPGEIEDFITYLIDAANALNTDTPMRFSLINRLHGIAKRTAGVLADAQSMKFKAYATRIQKASTVIPKTKKKWGSKGISDSYKGSKRRRPRQF